MVVIGAIALGVQDTVAVKAFSPLNDQGYMVTESMSFHMTRESGDIKVQEIMYIMQKITALFIKARTDQHMK